MASERASERSSVGNQRCQQWSDLEFVHFRQQQLSPGQRSAFQDHLQSCRDCLERYTLASLIADSEAAGNEEFLESEEWQKQRTEMARLAAQTSAHRQAPKRRAHLRLVAPSRPPLTQTLKVAAMVLAVLSPLAITYFLLVKPYLNRTPEPQTARSDEKAARLHRAAAAFESANARVKADSNNAEALYERALALEELLLWEDAQNDLRRVLALNPSSKIVNEAQARLERLTDSLNNTSEPPPDIYQQLDIEIDNYLKARAAGNDNGATRALTEAKALARQMEQSSGDRFGHDLNDYYSQVSIEQVPALIEARAARQSFKKKTTADNFSDNLAQAYAVKAQFEQLGAEMEVAQIEIEMVKYLAKTKDLDKAKEILDRQTEKAVAANHHYLHVQIVNKKAEYLSYSSNVTESLKASEQALEIATKLGLPRLVLPPLRRLSGIYNLNNENDRAFLAAHYCFDLARKLNERVIPIQLNQTLGISAFNLSYPTLAEHYLQYSLSQAEQQNFPSHQTISYVIFGVIQTEQQNFTAAETSFAKAFEVQKNIKDKIPAARALLMATGYFARMKMQAGDYDQAIASYNKAIAIASESIVRDKLALSQLHQGLGESLLARGKREAAKESFTIAADLDRQARERYQSNNKLLTFASPAKNSNELLRELQ